MTTTTFNLTREPWITVEALDSAVFDLSTRDTLRRAHELRALADPSPLVVAALTRHLLAVLHRSYDGPRSMREWETIARAGAFDAARVDAYLDRVEDRMDLFHPTHPFAQTSGLIERFDKSVRPIDELEIVRTGWGTARELFRHRPLLPAPSWPAARAARALLAHQAFALEGTIKKKSEPDSASAGPLARAALIVVRGQTLFQTLVANLLRHDTEQPVPSGGATDACSWEQAALPTELAGRLEPKRILRGYLDLLTWLSRRVQFVHGGATVTGFVNAVGQGLARHSPPDPMVTYQRHEEHGWLPVGIDIKRAFWRNSAALFESTRRDTPEFRRPRAIDLIANPEVPGAFSDSMYDIEVMGISSARAPIDAVRFERVQARGRCFDDPDAGDAVRGALGFSDQVVEALKAAVSKYAECALSPGERKPDRKAVRALVSSFGADPAVWSALGVAFEDLLRQLSEDPITALAAFRLEAREVVKNVFRGVTARSETTGGWLKARAVADHLLNQRLAALEETTPAGTVTEGSPTT